MISTRNIIVLLSILGMFSSCKTAKVPATEAQTTDTPTMQREPLLGGYTEYRELSDEDRQLFESTYTGKRRLKPQRVATAIAAGRNYRFLCLDRWGHEVTVVIFQPLPGRGEPYVKKVN